MPNIDLGPAGLAKIDQTMAAFRDYIFDLADAAASHSGGDHECISSMCPGPEVIGEVLAVAGRDPLHLAFHAATVLRLLGESRREVARLEGQLRHGR